MEDLAKPLTLKSGLVLPNRLVKAAMAEHMAGKDGLPDDNLNQAYAQWANAGWGMLLTGNVFVDPAYLGAPSEGSIPSTIDAHAREAWAAWARACSAGGTPTLVQLNHAGRQSPAGAGNRPFMAKTMSASAVPLDLGPGVVARAARALLFGTPRAMTTADIEKVIGQFVHSAKLSAEAGFAGVELHAAHGYLLAQFLSSRTNLRDDEWGGDALARARIVLEIIRRVKAATPRAFTVAIKFNSVDHQRHPRALEDALVQLKAIVDAGVDFIEISGGTFEDPQMMQPNEGTLTTRTQEREAFFLSFAKDIRSHFTDIPLMVTGGFRTRRGMAAAVHDGDCDLVGIGRPAVMDPKLPRTKIFNAEIEDGERLYTKSLGKGLVERFTGSRSAGAGAESTWYSGQIQKLSTRRWAV